MIVKIENGQPVVYGRAGGGDSTKHLVFETIEERDAAIAAGQVPEGAIVITLDDYEPTSELSDRVALLEHMLYSGQVELPLATEDQELITTTEDEYLAAWNRLYAK